ncbi:MAG: hypothetical protein IPP40_06900 [bacterium]|nr:hypothetical protein [bacterium]
MFRPINSDDHTRFRPPAEHVKQTEAIYRGQKRDFSYEVEQVKEEYKEHREQRDEPFGEDTFESTAEQEQNLKDGAEERAKKDRTPPESGHVDVQI